jgi:hypothetical protein
VPEGRERRQGNPAVALAAEVDAVLAPHPPVTQRRDAPEVEHVALVALGDGEDVRRVHGVPRSQRLEQPGVAGVGRGREQHVGAGPAKPHHGILDATGQRVEVDARAQQVVAAADHRDEVGGERQRTVELRADDVVELAAAHGEVRVGEGHVGLLGHGVEVHRQAVGPPDVGAGRHGVGVGHPLGEGVTDRDVTGPDGGGHGRLQFTGSAP